MQTFAHVTNGVVDVIETIPAGLIPGVNIFTPAYASGLQALSGAQIGEVAVGWTFLSGVFSAPPVVALTAPQLLSYANTKVAGLLSLERTYALGSGVSVKADASSASSANLAQMSAWGAVNASSTTNWIDNEGGVTSITGAQAQALALAVSTYAQSVWNELGTVMQGVAASTITTTAQIDAASWPV